MHYQVKNQALLLIILLWGLFSCQKDKDKNLPETQSKLTAEEQKVRLDKEGINFINHLEDLEKPDLMDPLVYFIEIADYIEEDQFVLSSKVACDFILSSKQHSGNSLKSAVTDDADSFKKVMKDNQGIYTYDRKNEIWKKTSATGKIEFIFPANKSTTTNNTSFVFNNLTTTTVTNYDLYEDLKDLAKTLDINLKVDNVLKYGYSISNEYNSDDIPTKESSTLVIAPYKFTEEYILSNDKNVTFNSTMSINNNVFMTIGATSEGDFTNSLLTEDEIEEEDIVKKVNAYVQIENVEVLGDLDFKTLAIKLKKLDNEYEDQYDNTKDQYPKSYYEDCVSAYKLNGILKMKFVDKNEVFATLLPYVTSEKDWYYDYSQGHYNSIEYTRNDVGFKIEFTDGSKVDDSYFDSGFDEIVDKLNSIIRRINKDYDESIDEIDY